MASYKERERKFWEDVASDRMYQWQREFQWDDDFAKLLREKCHHYVTDVISTSDFVKVSEYEHSQSSSSSAGPPSSLNLMDTKDTIPPISISSIKPPNSISNPHMCYGSNTANPYWSKKQSGVSIPFVHNPNHRTSKPSVSSSSSSCSSSSSASSSGTGNPFSLSSSAMPMMHSHSNPSQSIERPRTPPFPEFDAKSVPPNKPSSAPSAKPMSTNNSPNSSPFVTSIHVHEPLYLPPLQLHLLPPPSPLSVASSPSASASAPYG